MSPDYFFNFLFNISDLLNKEENLKFHISKIFLKNDKTSILKVVIPSRGGGESFVDKILINRLYKKGYSCLAYRIPGSVLSSDINETVRYFDLIKNQIKSDISKLKNEHHFKRIDIVAASMGVVSACLISNDNDDINNLYFIVPGSNLALSLWNGIRTQNLRNIYEQQNINQEQLNSIWKVLAPKNNINELNNKNIFLSISKQDKIIPYIFGKELMISIKNMYPDNIIVQENNYLGHYLTVVKYYLFSRELMR